MGPLVAAVVSACIATQGCHEMELLVHKERCGLVEYGEAVRGDQHLPATLKIDCRPKK